MIASLGVLNMFFNLEKYSLVTILSLTFTTLNYSGCGLNVNEGKNIDKPIVLQSTTCLDDSIAQMKLMVKGQGQESKIPSSIQCFMDTLDGINNKVQGNNKDYFTTDEIQYFINKNFVKSGNNIPLDLIEEAMKFKVVLIGGDTDVLLKSEIKKINTLLNSLIPELIKLNPHLNVITQNWDYSQITLDEKDIQFNKAKVALNKFAAFLSTKFQKTNYKYTINSLMDLLVKGMSYAEVGSDKIAHVEKHRDLAIQVQSNLISNSSVIKYNDWPVVTKGISETLFLVLRSNYYGKIYNQQYGLRPENKLSKISYILNDVANAVAEILDMQGDPVLTYQQMQPIFNSVFKTYNLNIYFDIETIQDITLIKAPFSTITTNNNFNGQFGWTKNDFIGLQNVVNVFFHELGITYSEFKAMSNNPDWKTDYKSFLDYESKITSSVERASKLFIGNYDLQNLKSFLNSLVRSGIFSTNNSDILSDYDKYYDTLLAVHKLINASTTSDLTSSDLSHSLVNGVHGYFNYLEYKNYVDSFSTEQTEFNLNAKQLLNKVTLTINQILDQHKFHFLATNDLIGTYRTIEKAFDAEPKISNNSLQIILNTLWSKILISPESRLAGSKLNGFNKEAWRTVSLYVDQFLTSNLITSKIFKNKPEYSQTDYIKQLVQLISTTSDASELRYLNEMKIAASSSVPLTFENKYLKILDPRSLIYNQQSITSSNISRLVSFIVIRSLTLNKLVITQLNDINSYIKSGLNLPELQGLFDIIRPVLVDLDIISAENLAFMKKRFIEADLFVPRANGNDMAEFFEIHDIALHLISGEARSKSIKVQIAKDCLDPLMGPITRKTEIYHTCLLNVYRKYNIGFENLPFYTNLKKSFDIDRFNEYAMNLLIAAGHTDNSHQTVLVENADNYAHVVQYVEMMFSKFDKNRDGSIKKDDALAAFPTFKNVIKKVVEKDGASIKDEELPGVFIYFLKNGRGPKGIIEKYKFSRYIKNEKNWEDLNADRFSVSVVFKFLAAAM